MGMDFAVPSHLLSGLGAARRLHGPARAGLEDERSRIHSADQFSTSISMFSLKWRFSKLLLSGDHHKAIAASHDVVLVPPEKMGRFHEKRRRGVPSVISGSV